MSLFHKINSVYLSMVYTCIRAMDFDSILNKNISIWGAGGNIYIDKGGHVRTAQRITDGMDGKNGMYFLVEQPCRHQGTNIIALRSCTGKYLTVSLYSDNLTDSIYNTLALHPKLVEAGLVRLIVEYAVPPQPISFSYEPAMLSPGPPSFLQTFRVEYLGEGRAKSNKVGLVTHTGAYLRSQLWDSSIGQSPHCRGDETWIMQL